jgi:hypothetical protein
MIGNGVPYASQSEFVASLPFIQKCHDAGSALPFRFVEIYPSKR